MAPRAALLWTLHLHAQLLHILRITTLHRLAFEEARRGATRQHHGQGKNLEQLKKFCRTASVHSNDGTYTTHLTSLNLTEISVKCA